VFPPDYSQGDFLLQVASRPRDTHAENDRERTEALFRAFMTSSKYQTMHILPAEEGYVGREEEGGMQLLNGCD